MGYANPGIYFNFMIYIFILNFSSRIAMMDFGGLQNWYDKNCGYHQILQNYDSSQKS
jgi:hypothetical protein